MIRIFVGYDPREAVAWHVLSHSILARASQPVGIVPVTLQGLAEVFRRPRHALQSTDFSFTRFLAPWLCGYEGWSLFMDCDMLMREDVAKLWALRDERYAVMCVQHDHRPVEDTKFLGERQTPYAKKNWSSLMLLNNARCRALTPEYVNTASGLALHQFHWVDGGDGQIGALPARWNHLVGYDRPDPQAANVHFTIGGPWFADYADCEHAQAWRDELAAMADGMPQHRDAVMR